MNSMTTAPASGFTDPVQQSQRAFRTLLDAMARPGLPVQMAVEAGHPAGLSPALAAALLTLCDFDTPVWLGPGMDAAPVQDWIRFHTGAPLVGRPGRAAFALLSAGHDMPALDAFSLGTDEAPERGATLLIQVAALTGEPAMAWRGPGIRESLAMSFNGLDVNVWKQREALNGVFPRGLDLYLASGSSLVALPRSTVITLEGA